jgi:hypothetical protein
MKRSIIVSVLLLLVCLLSVNVLFSASVPQIITFQGQLKESGYAVTGTKSMRFEVVNASGTVRWQSHASNGVTVSVDKGVYTVGLGDTAITNMNALTTADLDKNEKLYLRVYVEGVQLSPDILLSSSSYAYIAGQAETITANTTAGNSVIAALGASNANLGIGTATPVHKLEVIGQIRASNSSVNATSAAMYADDNYSYFASGYTGTGSYKPLVLRAGGNNTLFIDTTGNVGIGTINPVTRLQVGSSALGNVTGDPIIVNSHPTGVTGLNFGEDPDNRGWIAWIPASNYIMFGTRDSATTYSDVLTIKNNNVGIGVASPSARLHVGGTAGVDGIRFPDGTLMTSAGVGSASNLANATDVVVNADLDANDSGAVHLQVKGSDKLVVSNNGKVGVGTDSPTHRLHVVDSSPGIAPVKIQTTAAGGWPGIEYTNSTNIAAAYIGLNTVSSNLRIHSYNGHPIEFMTEFVGRMLITSSGNVGIGTTFPNYKLHVVDAGANPMALEGPSDAFTGLRLSNTNPDEAGESVAWSVLMGTRKTGGYGGLPEGAFSVRQHVSGNNFYRFTINNTGNIGIGTSSPVRKLHISDHSAAYVHLTLPSLGETVNDGFTLGLTSSSGILRLRENLPLYIGNNDNTQITISPSGNVGIGTTDPVSKLTVASSGTEGMGGGVQVKITAETGNALNGNVSLVLQNDNSKQGSIGVGRSGLASARGDNLYLASNSNIAFQAGGEGTNAHMFINTSGNVAIGTANPTQQLQLTKNLLLPGAPDNTAGNIFLGGDTTAGVNGLRLSDSNFVMGGYIDVKTDVPTKGLSFRVDTSNGGTTRMFIRADGNVGIATSNPTHLLTLLGGAYCDGTGAWVAGSDRAFKKEIEPLTRYGLDTVLKLQPVTYIHKEDKENRTQLGFIAQDVKPLVPEVVEGREGSYGLAYDRLIPVLVNAIKEQQKQVEELKQTNEVLKQDNQELKARVEKLENK